MSQFGHYEELNGAGWMLLSRAEQEQLKQEVCDAYQRPQANRDWLVLPGIGVCRVPAVCNELVAMLLSLDRIRHMAMGEVKQDEFGRFYRLLTITHVDSSISTIQLMAMSKDYIELNETEITTEIYKAGKKK